MGEMKGGGGRDRGLHTFKAILDHFQGFFSSNFQLNIW